MSTDRGVQSTPEGAPPFGFQGWAAVPQNLSGRSTFDLRDDLSARMPAQPIRQLLLIKDGHVADRLAVGVRSFCRNGRNLPVL